MVYFMSTIGFEINMTLISLPQAIFKFNNKAFKMMKNKIIYFRTTIIVK